MQPGSMDSEAGVFAMAFDHSGTRLITAEADKTIKLYREDDTAVSLLFLEYYINYVIISNLLLAYYSNFVIVSYEKCLEFNNNLHYRNYFN